MMRFGIGLCWHQRRASCGCVHSGTSHSFHAPNSLRRKFIVSLLRASGRAAYPAVYFRNGHSIIAEQQKWLKAEVEAGHFASLDDALSAAIVGLMAAKEDDLAWAKPLVDEALESIARGDASTLGEFRAEIRDTIAKLQ